MAYHTDKKDKSIVIDGFQNGIADDPYSGIADMRNTNLISIPGEASVNFATSKNSPQQGSGNVTSANAGADTVLLTGFSNLANLQAVVFSGGSLPGGITAGNTYWVSDNGSGNYQLFSDWAAVTLVNITSTGTGTWATIDMGIPQYFNHYKTAFSDGYFMIDSNGFLWTNISTGSAGLWRFFAGVGGSGNGLVSYIPSNSGTNGVGYLFAFKAYEISYFKITRISGAYTIVQNQGWNPATGTTGNTNYLNSFTTLNGVIHEATVGYDNKVYYTDSNWIGRFYQKDPNVPFDPATTSTYVFDQTAVLPFTDQGQCLAFLGNTLLIGGINNIIYPWDTFSSLPSFPIIVAESNIQKMVTVNTNTFALVGNRGRIYYTNGSQAQLWKKIPDHISGTVEPYFTWGGLTSQKNQIYFSAKVTTNSGTAINQYGGLWAADVDTKALRLANKLSYGTYAGYVNCVIPNFSSNPAGTGLYIGWNDGISTGAPDNGIDTTVGTPYVNSETIIVSDLIPIGSFDEPQNFTRIEYKLTRPLVSGESISLYVRLIYNTSDTGWGSALITDTTVGNFSRSAPVNFANAQWIQLQAVMSSTASSPSYVRLKELRIR